MATNNVYEELDRWWARQNLPEALKPADGDIILLDDVRFPERSEQIRRMLMDAGARQIDLEDGSVQCLLVGYVEADDLEAELTQLTPATGGQAANPVTGVDTSNNSDYASNAANPEPSHNAPTVSFVLDEQAPSDNRAHNGEDLVVHQDEAEVIENSLAVLQSPGEPDASSALVNSHRNSTNTAEVSSTNPVASKSTANNSSRQNKTARNTKRNAPKMENDSSLRADDAMPSSITINGDVTTINIRAINYNTNHHYNDGSSAGSSFGEYDGDQERAFDAADPTVYDVTYQNEDDERSNTNTLVNNDQPADNHVSGYASRSMADIVASMTLLDLQAAALATSVQNITNRGRALGLLSDGSTAQQATASIPDASQMNNEETESAHETAPETAPASDRSNSSSETQRQILAQINATIARLQGTQAAALAAAQSMGPTYRYNTSPPAQNPLSMRAYTRSGAADTKFTCRFCYKQFTAKDNVRQEDGSSPCSYHPGELKPVNGNARKLAWTCCGAGPTNVGGFCLVSNLAPGCVNVYHQDKKEAWKPETLTMADPVLFKE